MPDEVIIDLLSKRLEAGEAKGETGFILDGFPRTVRQAVSVCILFYEWFAFRALSWFRLFNIASLKEEYASSLQLSLKLILFIINDLLAPK